MKKCLLISGCLLLSVACSTPFDSGISGDTPVNSIAGEDETALCAAIETEAEAQGVKEAQKKFACYLGGQLTAAFSMDDSSFEDTCQESYDGCMSEEAEESNDTSCEFDFGDCSAPLADFEACTLAHWDEMKAMADEMNCKEFEDDDSGDDTDSESDCTSPEACKAFYDACPSMDICNDSN